MRKSALCAVGFLTRLPVPTPVLSDAEFAHAAAYFSWVGLGLGVALEGLSWLCRLRLDAAATGVLLVTALAWWTGALHLDGLADTFDGLSGARGRPERALEIMRDSRIGAHGASALVLGLLAKSVLCAALCTRQLVWVAPLVGRYACTLALAWFPYARTSGLGASFAGRVGRRELVIGAVPLVLLVRSPALALAGGVGLAAALLLALRVKRTLGGLTGDVHGALIELTELSVLLALAAFG
jgi:adenosylcobinamide-GDP ribazoletransferase